MCIALAIFLGKLVDFDSLRDRDSMVWLITRDGNSECEIRFPQFCDLPLRFEEVTEVINFFNR